MKKTVIIAIAAAFIVHLSSFTPARAQGFDWHRLNVAAEASFQPSVFQFGSGLLANHPERSVSLAVGYRLGQHWEVGLYTNLVGANAMSSGSQDIAAGQHVHWLYVENRYDLGLGATVQLHLVPYKMRHDVGFDMALRLGIDIGEAEADHIWGGLRWTYDLSRHVALTMSADIGSFYFGRTYNQLIGEKMKTGGRSSFGLQVEL